jgi:hypothetical protein
VRDVVPQEGQRRVAGYLRTSTTPAALVHLTRRIRGVPVNRLQMIGEVAIRTVLELAAQISDRAIHRDGLVNIAAGPSCRPAIVETSSAHGTDSSAAPRFAASFFVMTVTESFGTRAV